MAGQSIIVNNQPSPWAGHPSSVFVVVNPVVQRGSRALRELLATATSLGINRPVILQTSRRQPGRSQAARAIDSGADLVVAVGGDGTVRHVAGELAGTPTQLAVLPAGSGNVLASNLGLSPHRLAAAARVALTGSVVPVDLGWAQATLSNGTQLPAEPFTTMSGIGRDAETVRDTRKFLKRSWGWAAYAESGLRHALAPALAMSVQYDDQPPRRVRTWTVLGANVSRVPGGITVFPQARLDDAHLHVLEVPIQRGGQWLAIGLRGLGAPAPKARLRYRRTSQVKVLSAQPVPVQVDGDVINDVVELTLTAQAGALQLRVPPARIAG